MPYKKKGKSKKRRSHPPKRDPSEETELERIEDDDDDAGDSDPQPVSSSVIGKFPIDLILEKAEQQINEYQYDAALLFCRRAIDIDPNNIRALETTAGLLIELNECESAKEYLNRAIVHEPEDGYSKYLSIAQLLTGKDALEAYKKGMSIMKKKIEQNVAVPNLTEQISSVHCAIAELYMTDLSFDDNAEEGCFENLMEAIKYDEKNFEAYMSEASFWLVKGDNDQANVAMDKSLKLWYPQYKEFVNNPNEIEEVEVPSYVLRVSASKLLIELQRWDEASEVLNGLIEEDDRQIEVWYLLGLLNYLHGEDYFGNSWYYLKKALKVDEKYHNEECADIVMHVNKLLNELRENGQVSADDDDEEVDENVTDEAADDKENVAVEMSDDSDGNDEMQE